MKKSCLVLTILLAIVTLAPGPAGAATFSVTTDADSGPGSLRQAILDANAAGGANTVNVEASVRLIRVSSEMPVTSDVTVNGGGVTLQGSTTRIFNVSNGRPSFNRITFTNGKALMSGESGGAVYVGGDASAQFTNCTFFDNSASAAGGAVCVNSTSLGGITAFCCCTVADNSANDGGGVSVLNGVASFVGTIVVGNTSGSTTASDIHAASTGSILGNYNVVGTVSGSASFASGHSSLTNRTAEAVFLKSPMELETVDGVQVLRLAGSSPARDCIPASVTGVPDVDECGTARPQLSGFDAGAFEAKPVSLVSADLSGTPYIQLGQRASYDVTISPADATLDTSLYAGGIQWIAGDTSVISVDEYGTVTALREGVTTLTACVHGWLSSGAKTDIRTQTLTIRVGTSFPVVLIRFDPIPDMELGLNEVRTITPTVTTTVNGETVSLPCTLYISANTNGGVVTSEVLDNRTLRLTGRAPGVSTLKLTAEVNLSSTSSHSSSSFTDDFTVTVTQTGKSSGGSGGGCSAGFVGALPLALAALALSRKKK